MNSSPEAPPAHRALALDALRGLAILAMLLSGQLPFGEHALPAWMYHAQEPPPSHVWNGDLPGLTWVDLVFPTFLFSMGAAFPLALSRRLDRPNGRWAVAKFVLERGGLLAFFSLFVALIRPYNLSPHPTVGTWWLALLGFFIFFPVLTRLPSTWSAPVRWSVRGGGWLAALLYASLLRYPDGSGFRWDRSGIIIVVLTNMAVFGSLVWVLTRRQLLPRLGVMGLLLAFRLSNLPNPVEGWPHAVWTWSPPFLSWLYQFYYLQYLAVVIPGTIAGDLLLEWSTRPDNESAAQPRSRLSLVAVLLFTLVVLVLTGLEARWLGPTTLAAFGLVACTGWLLGRPSDATGRLYQRLFSWAGYWLVLGLCFEPFEGGIKKDHPTLSYYFVTCGLAICLLLVLSILIDVFRRERWLRLLIENGQNPMIPYAGINNFITPVLALTGVAGGLNHFASTPWRGFGKGLFVTLLMAWVTGWLTRRRVFWRT